tara:strand:+ start:17 stop:229 length:213 start_codon:yes stop_codon:yes gene_type:complete
MGYAIMENRTKPTFNIHLKPLLSVPINKNRAYKYCTSKSHNINKKVNHFENYQKLAKKRHKKPKKGEGPS